MKVETKEDNNRFINVCSNVIGSFWMNELIQMDNGNQFLKISGLLSISTFVYDVIMIFINIDVDKNIKTFIIIQIVSDFLIIILEVIAFYFFCKTTNLFKFFDKNNKKFFKIMKIKIMKIKIIQIMKIKIIHLLKIKVMKKKMK